MGFSVKPDTTELPLRRQELVINGERNSPDAAFNLRPFNGDEAILGRGSSRMDLALYAALESKADLIFMIITDGTPRLPQKSS